MPQQVWYGWGEEELSLGLLMNNSDEWESLRRQEDSCSPSDEAGRCTAQAKATGKGRLSPQLPLTHVSALSFLLQGPRWVSSPLALKPL